MERRRLGGTDLELSVIGLGTWVFGGRWGGADDADSAAACHAALDAGVNWIDTADIYGQGRAERIVGAVVRERRDEVIVATKGGVAWELGEGGLRIWREASADYLRTSLERSLRALGMDSVDLYQVHWPVSGVPAEETIGALLDMRREGKIRAIGVSNYHLADLEAAGAVAQIDSYQPGYHLMRREIEAAELPWCREHGVGVIAYGPLAHGLLTGKMTAATRFAADDWRASSELFADDAFPERIAVVEELTALAGASGRPGGVAELAVAWVLRRPEVTSAIIGARSAEQARANVALAGAPLTADEEREIEAVLARHPAASRPYGHGEPPDPAAEV
ncbi:aldo/keto reductase [Miltoncostaea marina]|uniref:aldo/keto reductase n=1 Tax=Miltoncostaea marina TaxID=2843215 RepID=UPI001C3CCBEC|nr:aldo/keto reductase [Miltoncostaea marina]